MRYAALIPVRNEFRFLPAVVGQLQKVVDRVLLVRSQLPHSGSGKTLVLDPLPLTLSDRNGVNSLVGAYSGDATARNAGLDRLQQEGFDYVLTIDSDEVFFEEDVQYLLDLCKSGKHRAIGTRLYTYWKTPAYRIDPPEFLVACMIVRSDIRYRGVKGRSVAPGLLELARPWCHHLSYVRTDEEVRGKLAHFTHADEVRPGWFESVWKAWDRNPEMENLHPVVPPHFRRAIRAPNVRLLRILEESGCDLAGVSSGGIDSLSPPRVASP